MTIIRPPALRSGDTVAIASPCFPAAGLTPHRFERAIDALERFGLRVRVMPNATRVTGYTAGSPEERAADLNQAFRDPEVRGILAAIGGWTSISLLQYLDWAAVAENPKVLCGFSDVSLLLNAIHRRTGLVTFHGPAVMTDWSEVPDLLPYSKESFRRATMRPRPMGLLEQPEGWTKEEFDWASRVPEHNRPRQLQPNPGWRVVRPGRARGRIVAGHLRTLHLLAGTRYWPDFAGAILFWEEDACGTAELERYLWTLRELGVYDAISGMVIGRPYALKADPAELALATSHGYDFPIVADVDFGHTYPRITLPIGIEAELVAAAEVRLSVLEAAVQ